MLAKVYVVLIGVYSVLLLSRAIEVAAGLIYSHGVTIQKAVSFLVECYELSIDFGVKLWSI